MKQWMISRRELHTTRISIRPWMRARNLISVSWRFSTAGRKCRSTSTRGTSSPGLSTSSWTFIYRWDILVLVCRKTLVKSYLQNRIFWVKRKKLSFNLPSLSFSCTKNVLKEVLVSKVDMNLQPRTIYLCRHGQSEYNAAGRLGGDSGLTDCGRSANLERRKKIVQWKGVQIDNLIAWYISDSTAENWANILTRFRWLCSGLF